MALKSKSLDAVRENVPTDQVTREEMVRVNINVPYSLRKSWHQRALDLDTTVTELITEAMAKHMRAN